MCAQKVPQASEFAHLREGYVWYNFKYKFLIIASQTENCEGKSTTTPRCASSSHSIEVPLGVAYKQMKDPVNVQHVLNGSKSLLQAIILLCAAT